MLILKQDRVFETSFLLVFLPAEVADVLVQLCDLIFDLNALFLLLFVDFVAVARKSLHLLDGAVRLGVLSAQLKQLSGNSLFLFSQCLNPELKRVTVRLKAI